MVIAEASAFLFDLDGTLVDSDGLHDRAFRAVLREVSPDLYASFNYDDVRGLPTEDAFRQIGVPAPLVCRASAEKRHIYQELVAGGELTAVLGAVETLERFARRQSRLAVVTSGSRGSARMALTATGLDPYFDAAVFADDVARGKPDPEPYLLACRRLRVAPDSAVVIEDAVTGVSAARAAGCVVIGVHNEELRPQVDAYFMTLIELGEAVAGL